MSRARLLISGSKVDQELRSIQQIIVALSDLDSAARTRVITTCSSATVVEIAQHGVSPSVIR